MLRKFGPYMLLQSRNQQGMRQQQLCELLGWKPKDAWIISDIERGKRRATLEEIEKFANIFGWLTSDRNLAKGMEGYLPTGEDIEQIIKENQETLDLMIVPAYIETMAGEIIYANSVALGLFSFGGIDINRTRPHFLEIVFGREIHDQEWSEELKYLLNKYLMGKFEASHPELVRDTRMRLLRNRAIENMYVNIKVREVLEHDARDVLRGLRFISYPQLGRSGEVTMVPYWDYNYHLYMDPRFIFHFLMQNGKPDTKPEEQLTA